MRVFNLIEDGVEIFFDAVSVCVCDENSLRVYELVTQVKILGGPNCSISFMNIYARWKC